MKAIPFGSPKEYNHPSFTAVAHIESSTSIQALSLGPLTFSKPMPWVLAFLLVAIDSSIPPAASPLPSPRTGSKPVGLSG